MTVFLGALVLLPTSTIIRGAELQAFANSVICLYTARLFLGLSLPGINVFLTMYAGDIA
jgi:hypothetical protein